MANEAIRVTKLLICSSFDRYPHVIVEASGGITMDNIADYLR